MQKRRLVQVTQTHASTEIKTNTITRVASRHLLLQRYGLSLGAHLLPTEVGADHLVQSFIVRPKEVSQFLQDVGMYFRMRSSFARRQTLAADRKLPVWVRLALSLVDTHAVEAAAFIEVEKVAGERVA